MKSETFAEVKKLLILVGFFLIAFLAFFFLFWRPGFADLRRYQKELSVKEAELAQLEKDARNWPKTITRERIRQYEDELERLWELIPPEEELAMLLDEIQNYTRAYNLEIVSLSRIEDSKRSSTKTPKAEAGKTESDKSRYERVSYRIYVQGSYFSLVDFLRRLEDSDRLITVVSVEIKENVSGNIIRKANYPIIAGIQFNIFYSKVGVDKVER